MYISLGPGPISFASSGSLILTLDPTFHHNLLCSVFLFVFSSYIYVYKLFVVFFVCVNVINAYFTLLYFTLLYFTLLYFTLLYFTLLYFTLLYFTLLYFTLLYFTLLYFTFTLLYFTLLYFTLLYLSQIRSNCFFQPRLQASQILGCMNPLHSFQLPVHPSSVNHLSRI